MEIRLASPLQKGSIVDGSGMRAVVWTQGCSHNCYGCHNPETHSFSGGSLCDVDLLNEEISKLTLEEGITFSGGDPMMQAKQCSIVAKFAKSRGLNVWCYTGYTFEQLLKLSEKREDIRSFLEEIDVIVDGKFVMDLKSLNLKFRGSRNQRIIDCQKSLKQREAILLENLMLEDDNQTIKKIEEELFI